MRVYNRVMGACLLASCLAPFAAHAGTLGDGCQAPVTAAFETYFAAEKKVTEAGAGACVLLDEQTAALDILVRAIGACREGEENRDLLPDIEALLRASVAQSIAEGCPQPSGAQ